MKRYKIEVCDPVAGTGEEWDVDAIPTYVEGETADEAIEVARDWLIEKRMAEAATPDDTEAEEEYYVSVMQYRATEVEV